MVNFPIDVVYTWVEGSDPKHQELLATISGKHKDYCRFANNDELYYSLYSIYKFAPWVRKVFIVVADYQEPTLQGLPQEILAKVNFVKHSEIMPSAALPTFSSHAIESCICYIPGLSEHFLYLNDDMFFGNRVKPEDFFSATGKCYFLMAWLPVPIFQPFRFIEPWLNVLHQTFKVCNQLVLPAKRKKNLFWPGLHQCHPCRKSLLQELWLNPIVKISLNEVLYSQLRSHYHINIIYLMYLMRQNVKVIQKRRVSPFKHFYVELKQDPLIFSWKMRVIKMFKPQLLCINNKLTASSGGAEDVLRNVLSSYFDGIRPPVK